MCRKDKKTISHLNRIKILVPLKPQWGEVQLVGLFWAMTLRCLLFPLCCLSMGKADEFTKMKCTVLSECVS